MKIIFKHELVWGRCTLQLHSDAQINKVDIQNGIPMIWEEHIEDNKHMVDRTFCIHGTGQLIPFNEYWVGTFFQDEYVWHVYEDISDE